MILQFKHFNNPSITWQKDPGRATFLFYICLMRILQSYSGRVVIFLSFVFSIAFSNKVVDVVQEKSTCVCAYDGFGYYMYLPHIFEKHSLRFSEQWAQNIQDKYCDGIDAYQIVPSKKGDKINLYHMGMSFLFLPSYAIGDLSARIGGYSTDGFSKPYHIAYLLNALLFIFLGLVYLRKLLLLFFKDTIVAYSLLILFFASNIYITFTLQYDLQHLYLFALNSIFLFHLITFIRTNANRNFWISVIILGLTVSIRPTQAIWGIVPFFLLFNHFNSRRSFWFKILMYPLFGIVWNIPQIIYWTLVGGEPFILNLHVEDIVLADPNAIDFLISYKKGWLLYSPIFLSLIVGFYFIYREKKTIFWATLVFTVIYIYVMSAWECWWYASSFGARVMVDIYPLLAIVIGFFVLALSKKWTKFIGLLFILGCIGLNLIQSQQMGKGYLHHERMTRQHYWFIFGKINMPNYTDMHLELDRRQTNTNWIYTSHHLPKADYELKVKDIYSLDQPLESEPNTDLTIGRLNLYDLIETDETLFEVKIVTKTSDSTKIAQLRMEIVNRYNCYGWNNFEISKGHIQGEFVTHIFKFNLVRIHHSKDQMQMYLDIWEDLTVEIKEMTITAYSLIRK